MNSFFLHYSEWERIIQIKKKKIFQSDKNFNNFESILYISKENEIYNRMISRMLDKNIFEISRISYLIIQFLDPYLTPHLKYFLYNDPDIEYSPTPIRNELKQPSLTNLMNTNQSNEFEYLPPLDNKIINILKIAIDLSIFIELQLNIQLFILYNHIQTFNNSKSNIKSNIESILSRILSKSSHQINDSTMLLLAFNIINSIGNIPLSLINKTTYDFIKDIITDSNLDTNFIKQIKNKLNNNTVKNNQLLDNFIINYNTDSITDSITDSNNNNKVWENCKTYILDIVRININWLNIILDILIYYLIQENQQEQDKLNIIKKCIINLIEMEIQLFETKLDT